MWRLLEERAHAFDVVSLAKALGLGLLRFFVEHLRRRPRVLRFGPRGDAFEREKLELREDFFRHLALQVVEIERRIRKRAHEFFDLVPLRPRRNLGTSLTPNLRVGAVGRAMKLVVQHRNSERDRQMSRKRRVGAITLRVVHGDPTVGLAANNEPEHARLIERQRRDREDVTGVGSRADFGPERFDLGDDLCARDAVLAGDVNAPDVERHMPMVSTNALRIAFGPRRT
ncbi:MAG: hypothetical protein FWD73_04255 [Polyangiaceae bacterium]|nr:hypothetical protein [Polyangiaceae bacterium]